MKFAAYFMSFYFLLGSFMPSSDWDEIPKVFELFNHYQHHQQSEAQPISFMEFLALHYGGESKHKEQEDHSRLPFSHVIVSAFTAIVQQPVFRFEALEKTSQKVLSIPKEFNPRDHFSELLQPPQV